MDYMIVDGELYHYGVPGMKWGKRTVRGHAGPGNYLTKKRQLAGDKKDLEYLNKGGHLSVGLTKKRQAAYDKRDKAALEKRITKTEEKIKKKSTKRVNKGRKKTNKLLQNSVKASAKTVSYGAQFATRLMQNNMVYGTTGMLFD